MISRNAHNKAWENKRYITKFYLKWYLAHISFWRSSRKKIEKECPFQGYKPRVFRNKRINILPEVVVKETHSNPESINDGSVS